MFWTVLAVVIVLVIVAGVMVARYLDACDQPMQEERNRYNKRYRSVSPVADTGVDLSEAVDAGLYVAGEVLQSAVESYDPDPPMQSIEPVDTGPGIIESVVESISDAASSFCEGVSEAASSFGDSVSSSFDSGTSYDSGSSDFGGSDMGGGDGSF